MKRIAKFHKVSFEQFAKDWKDTFEQYSEEEIRNIYDSLKLPKRATTGSVSAAWAQERQDTIVVSRDGTGNFRTLHQHGDTYRADYTKNKGEIDRGKASL